MAQLVVPAGLQQTHALPAGSLSRRLAVLLFTLAALLPSQAHADEPEPLLFLGIQRSTTIDKLASQMVVEHLKERNENLVQGAALTDTERRCRRVQCLGPLATQRQAALVLDGEVQQVGGNRTLRVIMHLYLSRQRQQQELENLCSDCDETKLGIVLTNTTTDLLGQYRKGAVAMDQLAALLDATPAGLPDRNQTAPIGTTTKAKDATAPTTPSPTGDLTPTAPVAAPTEMAPAPAPPVLSPLAVNQGPLPGGPAVYPTPLPPLPVLAGVDGLAADPTPRPLAKRGLSTKRKAIAGVFGALGAGTLIASIVLTVLDHRIASNHTYNPSGSPCVNPIYAGQDCVFSTVRLWAPGYGVGGLLLGGMILTLAIPERGR